jgi:hypothetical protein
MIGNKQVVCQDAEKAIFCAFRVIKKLVCHLAQLHGEEDCTVKALKEKIGISVWAALINFVLGLNTRTGLWEKCWTSIFQRDVEGIRLCSPIMDIIPWDSRPGKMHKMTVFRPQIAMQPSDLIQLCAKSGNPLVQVSPVRGDQLVVTEETLDSKVAALDKAFHDGLLLCIDPHAGSRSKVSWSPAPTQPVVENSEEPVWADGLLDPNSGSLADKQDAEEEGEAGDDCKAVDELEAERRAARIVGRFGRYCIFRFAVARAVKEAQKVLQPAAGEVDNGGVTFLDPYQRSCRYSMLVEQKFCVGNIVRNGLYNMCGPILVLDDFVPQYPEILEGLCRFRDLYSRWICKVLISADLVGLELSSLAQLPLWRGNHERMIEIDCIQEALSIGVNSLESTLFLIDQRLMWPWAMRLIDSEQAAGSDEPDILATMRRLEAELVPQAIALVNELGRQEAQLLLWESGGVQAEQGVSSVTSLLPLGVDCRARSYQDGLEYSARILAYTASGYLLEFQQDQATGFTCRQDTHTSDVMALSAASVEAPAEGIFGCAFPDDSMAGGRERCSSSFKQVTDEPEGAPEGTLDPVVDSADGLGWLEEERGKGNQMRVRRFGRSVCQPFHDISIPHTAIHLTRF